MSQVLRSASGYKFVGLSAVGKQLVNEFQRHHSHLCHPSPDPSYRFIRHGSPEEIAMLERLAADVRVRDPEPTEAVLKVPRRRVGP